MVSSPSEKGDKNSPKANALEVRSSSDGNNSSHDDVAGKTVNDFEAQRVDAGGLDSAYERKVFILNKVSATSSSSLSCCCSSPVCEELQRI